MGILSSIVEKLKKAQARSQNRHAFRAALIDAASDGKLTDEELEQLKNLQNELGLSEQDISEVKIDAYLAAYNAAKSDSAISREELDELDKIQRHLSLTDDRVHKTKKELTRLRLINEIQNGNPPAVTVTNVVLQKTEKAFWIERASLIEEKVIRREYQGGSRGVSIRIMKGVSYRIGATRGRVVTETGAVEVSTGELVITSKRLIFRGDRKSFSIRLDKILGIELYSDGIDLSELNKSKHRILRFIEPNNHEIVGAIMNHAINRFGT